MRYIKMLSSPLMAIKLEKWEQAIIDAMQITPFISWTNKSSNMIYCLSYINDSSPLDNFNKMYIQAMEIQEIDSQKVLEIIRSISPMYNPIIDTNGEVIFKQSEDIDLKIYTNPHIKPYNSWIWNTAEKRWQSPYPHPLDYEGRILWDDNAKKWIENIEYSKYSWNEETLSWICLASKDENVIQLNSSIQEFFEKQKEMLDNILEINYE